MVFWPTLLLLLMIDFRCCLGNRKGHSTSSPRHECDATYKESTENTPVLFSAPDSGNLTLRYHVTSGHMDTNIRLMLHIVGEEAREPCSVEWSTFRISSVQRGKITFNYIEDTKTTHVQGEQVGSQSYIGYKLMDVEVRTSGTSSWQCRNLIYSSIHHGTSYDTNTLTITPTCPKATSTTTPTTTSAAAPTPPTTSTTTITTTTTSTAAPTPPTISTTNTITTRSISAKTSTKASEHGLIIALCVVCVIAVISLCGMAYYRKKTRSAAGHHDDPSQANPTAEMVGVATGADVAVPKPAGEEHIYEEWNESYQLKDQQRGSTHSSINSIYQDYQPKDQQRGSTHSDVNSIYQPFDA